MAVYTVPRVAVAAHVTLATGPARPGQVFVAERVPQHDGPETVLEMLNRPEPFFAFRPEETSKGDAFIFISKVQAVSVAQHRQAPISDPARLSAAKLIGLELVLADESTLAGWASVELPPEQSRLLDYLNASNDPFFAVWTHAATHYVNRGHVRFARPLD
ncbi:MAG TPA: hypothetical protein VLV16_06780 [Gemmatimonadales bacterium]|nr:hypothetical protein [Gemmatimonadales bacterium]